ncbi:DUF1707 domain-containing protein [Nocardia otitidiscaviarum]|uniref:DUF1707 SHOCT-like domain-containing protein n=1 Tax=Nocardia otitidiscaviarum TaxID=1823 RepID=UPI001895C871|nr:DUF1707 domain-containing protein [Nocardia otitidiscaviarum]MBF6237704.1 DUF1707 domain-containing protein [Nocardia otitidiscaviarum]
MGGPEAVSSVGAEHVVGDRDLRVSDVEREHVGRLLQRAVGLGMLSLGEFTERMDTALAAKTRGELNAVLVDLPGIRLAGQPGPRPFPGAPPAAPHGPPPTVRSVPNPSGGNIIRARMSGVTRKGRWQVHPTLLVDSFLSGVTLDFTQAVMSTQIVEIRADISGGSLNLVLPSEATADLNGLELIGSGVTNKVHTGPPMGPLHLVVHGRIRFGSVTAKHPLSAHWKKLMGM